jgi:hypothetical protein
LELACGKERGLLGRVVVSSGVIEVRRELIVIKKHQNRWKRSKIWSLTMLRGPGMAAVCIFASVMFLLLVYRCPLSLHLIPIQRGNVNSKTFFLKPSKGGLDIAIVLVAKLYHCHPTD